MNPGKDAGAVSMTIDEHKGKRSPYWDNIKGVLIFLVVFAHCLYGLREQETISVIVKGIYFFHMPAFVFVSGYFSKRRSARTREAFLRLAVAYAIITAPFIVRAMVNGTDPHLLRPYFSAWYLLALMGWRGIAPCFEKVRGIIPIFVVFSLLVGFWPDVGGQKILAVNKIVTFLPFFMAGYLLPEDKVRTILEKDSGKRFFIGVSAAAAGAAIGIAGAHLLNIEMKQLLPGAYAALGYQEPLARLCIFAVAFLAITAILYLTPDRAIPFVTKSGRNSMSIYLVHRIITIWFYEAAFIGGLRIRWQLLLAFALAVCICLCFGSDRVGRFVDKMTSSKTFAVVIFGLLFIVPIVWKMVLAM